MISYQLIQSITVRDYSYQSSLMTQRDNRVSSDRKIFFLRLWICTQQSVHQSKKLHNSLILSCIFMSFEKKNVFTAVISKETKSSWVLLTRIDWENFAEFCNFCNLMATSKSSRYSNLKVFRS